MLLATGGHLGREISRKQNTLPAYNGLKQPQVPKEYIGGEGKLKGKEQGQQELRGWHNRAAAAEA